MTIALTAIDDDLFNAWKAECGSLECVDIVRGSILDVATDAVVSPANSYGFMDGGIDAIYTRHFGSAVQRRLQEAIREFHFGELLLGTAEIVETESKAIPFLVASPTMRVPMILESTSIAPFLATRAVLRLIKSGLFAVGKNRGQRVAAIVKTVAFPGLGTGVGRVDPRICAKQVRAAIDEVLMHEPHFPSSWFEAQRNHQRLYTTEFRDLQFEDG